jgi:DNA-binding phage protein
MAKPELARVARAARKVERAEGDLQRAREELQTAVQAAVDTGETIAEIARTIGVSRQRVYQILRR